MTIRRSASTLSGMTIRSHACVMIAAMGLSSIASAQCVLLVRESFRPGDRPHGNNGRLRNVQIHDALKDFWPQAGAMWMSSDVSGVPSWGFAGSSLDPAEVDPLDEFNGTAFGEATAAALVPFVRPGVPFTLSADVVMGLGTDSEARLGYTSSPALQNNLATGGALWMTLNGKGDWTIRANGSVVVASGTEPLWGEWGGGWLRMELTLDPASSMVSGCVMNHVITPTPVPALAPSAYFAMEANQSWVVVNNLSITTGPTLATAISGDVSVCDGGTLALTLTHNADAPMILGWSREWRMLTDGPQEDGSVVSGATTTSLTISNASPTAVGGYRAHVANACGSAFSLVHAVESGGAACNSCPCTADFDGSGGTPDVGDIDAYFGAWLGGDPAADADCTGGTPDSGDIDMFFAAWLAGGC